MLAKWSPLELAKLAILGSLLMAIRFFRWLLILPALIIAARETSMWPSAILGLVAVGIPIILFGVGSLNRRLHPDRQPARWLKHGEERLQSLETVLTLYGIAAFLVIVVMGFLVHDNASLGVVLPSWICCAPLAWSSILGRYVGDRKYIPPPSPPNDPSKATRPNPLHSDHWGRHYVADTDPNAAP
jgi:hypothetical protein